ncbi:diaminopimelate epimerase [Nakamurella deserti]|uniref:diaminopimelate epimerase n=1 Tax=Nakamurella deserti TaxID=2164074 RepID=UPI000DBE6AD9|nr:diaminopimelate epimerase [Nakamurella deserti]
MTRPTAPIDFLKGHGTENDFVLLPDREGTLDLDAAQVRALCDRRSGIGGDGVIRIAPSGDGDHFLMDYRNADGSLAEMCGNGARLFAHFLYTEGWVPVGPFRFHTRGGLREARRVDDGDIAIGMGSATVGAPATTAARLHDGSWQTFEGVAADVGNPHLVVHTDVDLGELDLTVAPRYDAAAFPDGVNIEFVNVRAADNVSMRVFERGVGETQSCGTGTVAVAAAHLAAAGRAVGTVTVTVPGGVVRVDVDPAGSTLTGPAVIVGRGQLDPAWWTRASASGSALG